MSILFSSTPRENTKVRPVGGKMGFFDEDEDFEREAPLQNSGSSEPILGYTSTAIGKTAEAFGGGFKNLSEAILEIGANVAGVESGKPMSATGEMRFNNPEQQKQEAQAQKAAIQARNVATITQSEQLYETQKVTAHQEELVRVIGGTVSLEELNNSLGFQASYERPAGSDPYYIYAFRAKQIEQQKEAEKQEKAMEAQTVNPANPLDAHKIDTNTENQRLSNAVG